MKSSEIRFFTSNLTFFSSVINLLVLVSSVYSLQVLDRVISSGNLHTLFWLTLLVVFVYFEINYIQNKRAKIIDKINSNLQLHFHDLEFEFTALGGKAEKDILKKINDFRGFFQNPNGIVGICDLVWAILFLLSIFAIHKVSGFVVLFGTVFIAIFSLVANNVLIKNSETLASEKSSVFSDLYRSFLASKTFIKSCNLLLISNHLKIKKEDLLKTKSEFIAIKQPISQSISFLKSILQTILFAVGAILVIKGEITSGSIIATSILFGKILTPFSNIFEIISMSRGFNSSKKTVLSLIDNISDSFNKKSIINEEKFTLRLEKFYVKQNQSDSNYILKNIDIQIPSGKIIGLTGGETSGKTAFLLACSGVINGNFGKASVNFHDISSIKKDEIFSYLDDFGFFVENETIIENVTRFDKNQNRQDEFEKILRLTGCEKFVLSLEKKEYSLIASINPSYSTKKLMFIAQAFYKFPKIILLNKPCIGLSDRNLNLIINLIKMAKSLGSTVICESQNREILEICDNVILMNNGEIESVKSGSEFVNNI